MSRNSLPAPVKESRPPARLGISRFERHPVLTLSLTLGVLLSILEGSLRVGYAVWGRGYDSDTAALLRGDGIDDVDLFWTELERLSKDLMRYHPYRWYALPPSIPGRYHSTDRDGFRADGAVLPPGAGGEQAAPALPKVGFFGGSTAYSVRTTAATSIPGLLSPSLERAGIDIVNLGLGGYSSTAELMTFIEVVRNHRQKMRWAVFLDGVNEVSRYAEQWQEEGPSGAGSPYYRVLGYRWAGTLYGLANELHQPVRSRLALGRLTDWLLDRVRRWSRPKLSPLAAEDYRRAGAAIAAVYFANLTDIRALAQSKGIAAIFLLQPTLFHVRQPTPREERLRKAVARRAVDVGQLYEAAYQAIRTDPRFQTFGVHDLTDAFERRRGEIFYDDCHVTSAGNALLAERIRPLLPSGSLP